MERGAITVTLILIMLGQNSGSEEEPRQEAKSAMVETSHQRIFENYDVSEQLNLMKQAMTTRIDETRSPGNVTAVQGDTAMLVCTVVNIGDKSVSWLRLRDPIPQLMSVNNVTNTLNTRYRALVRDYREFVLMVRNVVKEDEGDYECQVSGPKHTSLTKLYTLTVIESRTEILGGPDIYIDQQARLELVCRVSSGSLTPAYIIWKKDNKILKFEGGETSSDPFLDLDPQGRHLSTLVIPQVKKEDSGRYICEPAVGPAEHVTIHVLEVQAVLGEGGSESEVPSLNLAVDTPSTGHSRLLPHLTLLLLANLLVAAQ